MTIQHVLIALLLALSVGAAPAASLTDEQKCGAKKGKALIKYSKCLDKAYDKYYSNKDPEGKKLLKCDAKCVKSITAAEKNGTCAINNDSINAEVCGPSSYMDEQANCRYLALHFGLCTYPP